MSKQEYFIPVASKAHGLVSLWQRPWLSILAGKKKMYNPKKDRHTDTHNTHMNLLQSLQVSRFTILHIFSFQNKRKIKRKTFLDGSEGISIGNQAWSH